jgi:hypothetical protein
MLIADFRGKKMFLTRNQILAARLVVSAARGFFAGDLTYREYRSAYDHAATIDADQAEQTDTIQRALLTPRPVGPRPHAWN